MFLFAILEFCCIECFEYALASLVFNILLCLYTYPTLIASHSFFLVCRFSGIAILPSSLHSCKALLSFVLFSLTLLSLTLLVVPLCPKVVVMTLTFSDNPKILFYYLQSVFVKPSTSSYRWSSCPAAMGCSPLYFMNFISARYRERVILYWLYPIFGPYSFIKFIACCITCQKNGTGSFSLMPPEISLLNSEVYPVTPWGCTPSSGAVLWVSWFTRHSPGDSYRNLDNTAGRYCHPIATVYPVWHNC